MLPDIEQVIPHRGEMRLIDRLLSWDADNVAVEAVVRADGALADEDGAPAWLGIEYMAQAIAAWAGCRARARGEAVKPGFLLGTRRYECGRRAFAPGTVLRIEAHCELMGDNGLGMFACRILDAGEEIARANLSVFEPPDTQAYLNDAGARENGGP